MILLAALALLLPAALGFLAMHALVGRVAPNALASPAVPTQPAVRAGAWGVPGGGLAETGTTRFTLPFLFFLGWPLGWAITATGFFVCSLLFAHPAVPSALLEFAALALLAGRFLRSGAPRLSSSPPPSSPILATIFIQLALAAVVISLRAAQAEPLGSWDGWAIWNFHARFMDRAGTAWPALLHSPQVAWSHPDYPPLVPANVARLWAWTGSESPAASAAVSLLFGVGTVGLLVTGLRRRRGPAIAWLAGIALVSTPFFVTFASNEHADIPLGLYMLAVCVLLSECSGSGIFPSPGAQIALHLLTGFAAFVKNEGLMFALIAELVWVFDRLRRAALRRSIGPAAIGLLLALAPLLYFKFCLAPPNDLASSHPSARLGQLFDPARHRLILAAAARDLAGFGQWHWLPFIPLALLLIGPGGAAGRWERFVPRPLTGTNAWKASATRVLTVLLLTALGFYAVYLLSPFDLQWHLDSSLVRLLMQLWPSALFLWGLVERVAPPAPSSPVVRTRPAVRAGPGGTTRSTNVILAVIQLAWFNHQLAPNELAATRFHSVRVVAAADWYPTESDAHDRWSWSSGQSTLHLVCTHHHPVTLHFAARGLGPLHLTVRQQGRIVWTAAIDRQLRRFTLPAVAAPSDLVFSSDQPGLPESSDARSRTLAFALYDVRIE